MVYVQSLGIIIYFIIGFQFGKYLYNISYDVMEERKQSSRDHPTDEPTGYIVSVLGGLVWPIVVVIGLFKTIIR